MPSQPMAANGGTHVREVSRSITIATVRVVDPVDVVVSPDLTITEYVGRVASQDAACSACVATVTAATKEAPSRP